MEGDVHLIVWQLTHDDVHALGIVQRHLISGVLIAEGDQEIVQRSGHLQRRPLVSRCLQGHQDIDGNLVQLQNAEDVLKEGALGAWRHQGGGEGGRGARAGERGRGLIPKGTKNGPQTFSEGVCCWTGGGGCHAGEVSVPVGTSGSTHWFEFLEISCLHYLAQAPGMSIFTR